MKNLLTTLLLLVSLYSFAQEKQQRTVGEFTGVSAATGLQVELTQGNENAVWVSASDNKYLDNLKTVVENGVLKIYYDNKDKLINKDKNGRLQAFVTYKSIDKLIGSSGAMVNAANVMNVEQLSFDFSSGAMFTGEIKTTEFNVEQSGGAICTVSGTATEVHAEASGGGIFKGASLSATNCKAVASSGGVIKLKISGKLTATASSGGAISYKGDPAVEKSVSTGGIVQKN